MVLLTIAISGGPFLGLLGTVIGVMITFAAIAAVGRCQRQRDRARTCRGARRDRRRPRGRHPVPVRLQLAQHARSSRSRPTIECSSTSSSRGSPSSTADRSERSGGTHVRLDRQRRQGRLRRYQHHADAGSRLRADGDLHHHDDGLGAGHQGQPAEGERGAVARQAADQGDHDHGRRDDLSSTPFR